MPNNNIVLWFSTNILLWTSNPTDCSPIAYLFLSISFFSDEVSVLLEMFPEACSLEIEQCLNDANGNTEAAVHLMLLKNGESCDDEGQESNLKIIDWSPKVKGWTVFITSWSWSLEVHLSLTEFEVLAISYGPRFFPLIYSQARSARAVNQRKKRRSLTCSTDWENEVRRYLLHL